MGTFAKGYGLRGHSVPACKDRHKKEEQEVVVHFRIHTQNKNTQLYTIQRMTENSAFNKEPMYD